MPDFPVCALSHSIVPSITGLILGPYGYVDGIIPKFVSGKQAETYTFYLFFVFILCQLYTIKMQNTVTMWNWNCEKLLHRFI